MAHGTMSSTMSSRQAGRSMAMQPQVGSGMRYGRCREGCLQVRGRKNERRKVQQHG